MHTEINVLLMWFVFFIDEKVTDKLMIWQPNHIIGKTCKNSLIHLFVSGSTIIWVRGINVPLQNSSSFCFKSSYLKDLFNANACWLVLIYDTLIIPYVANRISKYVSYIL